MSQALEDFLWGRPQVHDNRTLLQGLTVLFAKHCTTTCGENGITSGDEASKRHLLQVTKRRFPFNFEETPNARTDLSFYFGIDIHKRSPKCPCQLAPYGGLACTRQTDQTDYKVHAVPEEEVVMPTGTEVINPPGEVNFKVKVPELTLSNEYVIVAELTLVVLGTGVPPLTLAVMPVVATTLTVVPAAIGFNRPAGDAAGEYVLLSPTRILKEPVAGRLNRFPPPTR